MNLIKKISSGKRPFVVAGPCSAESEEQVMSICVEIAKKPDVRLLRAGIWKPRTRPNSFEGLGKIALPWLVNAGKVSNLPIATEVANTKHVEESLKAGVDVLWIGARTTVNPFAVQEIANALSGVNIPVMIKNPINPDLQLWLGAFERLEQAGLKDLSAIHRGFSLYNHDKYRNVPNWKIPIALKENRPDIPIICDPSHISGNRNLLLEVSQKAMDLNFEGLMIETHPNPGKAWSDAEQQVTSKGLGEILSKLVLRSVKASKNINGRIEGLRSDIAELDDQIFNVLKDRMLLSETVGKLKREKRLTILDQKHWNQIITSRINNREDNFLSKQFIRQLMDAIHQESIRHQTEIMNTKKLTLFKSLR